MRITQLLVSGLLAIALPVQFAAADVDGERTALARIHHELQSIEPLLARISHRYVGRRVECVPLSTPMDNTSEWLRLKQEAGCRSRKSALVSTHRCLPLDKICVRRQGHPRALLQTQINTDIGR